MRRRRLAKAIEICETRDGEWLIDFSMLQTKTHAHTHTHTEREAHAYSLTHSHTHRHIHTCIDDLCQCVRVS